MAAELPLRAAATAPASPTATRQPTMSPNIELEPDGAGSPPQVQRGLLGDRRARIAAAVVVAVGLLVAAYAVLRTRLTPGCADGGDGTPGGSASGGNTPAGGVRVPTVVLGNAAQPGTAMPAIGLGTGAYGTNGRHPSRYPECWNEAYGCGDTAKQAVLAWLLETVPRGAGHAQSRIDSSNDYGNMRSVGEAMQESGLPRDDIFLLSKVGPIYPLGFDDALAQVDEILAAVNTSYVDALLIHWPHAYYAGGRTSSDPACNPGSELNATDCRVNTWRAMLSVLAQGRAKAVGVSNYHIRHLQEIMDAGLALPSINQIPHHLYRSSTQQELIQFCARHGITVVAYSPLGVPDWHDFSVSNGLPSTQLEDPVVTRIARTHGVTAAQVIIAWQWALRLPCNPRTLQVQHMHENVAAFSVELTPLEVSQLSERPNPSCAEDDWYECPSYGSLWP